MANTMNQANQMANLASAYQQLHNPSAPLQLVVGSTLMLTVPRSKHRQHDTNYALTASRAGTLTQNDMNDLAREAHQLQAIFLPDASVTTHLNVELDRLLRIPAGKVRTPQPSLTGGMNNPAKPSLTARIWMNDRPHTFETHSGNLTSLGMIYLRLNMREGDALPPHIAHMSAHVHQERDVNTFKSLPSTKAFVFIVTDEGEDITLTEEHPHLFPSDNLILRIRMITDK